MSDLFTQSLFGHPRFLRPLIHQSRTDRRRPGESTYGVVRLPGRSSRQSGTTDYLVGGTAPTRHGNAHPNASCPIRFFPRPTAQYSSPGGRQRPANSCAFAAWQQVGHLAADPRFVTNADRVGHRDTIVGLLALRSGCAPDRGLRLRCLKRPTCPAVRSNTIGEVFADPQRHRARAYHFDDACPRRH